MTEKQQCTHFCSLSDDGLEVVAAGEAINPTTLRPKLLQFSENVRPAFYGTWRKKSTKLSARNPLKQDKVRAINKYRRQYYTWNHGFRKPDTVLEPVHSFLTGY